jgi:hypothetical protein
MKAVLNEILVRCEVILILKIFWSSAKATVIIKLQKEVIHFHIKFLLNLNTHKIISKVNIKLKLSLEMGKYRQNVIHNGCTV